MFNRRKSKRLETAVPLRLMLLGMSKAPPTIETTTTNISPMGLSMKLRVTLSNGVLYMHEGEKPFNLIPYLVLGIKEVALEIILPPHDEIIRGKGKVIWYDFGSQEDAYFFKAGISLKEMETKDRKRWEGFVRDTALMTGKVWHYIQIGSACTFIAGIIIFIAGSCVKLAVTAKIGFFCSLIGFIGFVIGWWRHRSFMLFKRFQLF
jgi:hypothetical protein